MFYRQITMRKGLPFAVEVPNDLTAATLRKSKAGVEVEEFDSVDDMFESWDR